MADSKAKVGPEAPTAAGAMVPGEAAPTEASPECLYLEIPGLGELTGKPRERFEMHVRGIAVDVLKEASNLATAKSLDGREEQIEFHSDHVDKAVTFVSERGFRRKARPKWYLWIRILLPIFTLGAGAAVGIAVATDWAPAWVGVAGFLTCGAVIFTIIQEVANAKEV